MRFKDKKSQEAMAPFLVNLLNYRFPFSKQASYSPILSLSLRKVRPTIHEYSMQTLNNLINLKSMSLVT